jgi:hypothetical protein
MSFRISDGTLFALVNRSTLYTIDILTGAATLVGSTGFTGSGNGLEFSAGDVLYNISANRVLTIDPTTGAGTDTGVVTSQLQALDLEDTTGTLWGIEGRPLTGIQRLVTLDPATGAQTIIAILPFAISIDALAISPSVAAVPEPSTFALFGVSLLGLAALRRRRKATAPA